MSLFHSLFPKLNKTVILLVLYYMVPCHFDNLVLHLFHLKRIFIEKNVTTQVNFFSLPCKKYISTSLKRYTISPFQSLLQHLSSSNVPKYLQSVPFSHHLWLYFLKFYKRAKGCNCVLYISFLPMQPLGFSKKHWWNLFLSTKHMTHSYPAQPTLNSHQLLDGSPLIIPFITISLIFI